MTMIGNEERYSRASSDTVVEVVLGVDTHLDVHVAVALDQLGRRLDTFSVPTTKKGYEDLLAWAEGFGAVRCAGVEGTSSYGAGLARYLRVVGIEVMEVERDQNAATGVATASLTRETPRLPPGRYWPARQPESPKAEMVA